MYSGDTAMSTKVSFFESKSLKSFLTKLNSTEISVWELVIFTEKHLPIAIESSVAAWEANYLPEETKNALAGSQWEKAAAWHIYRHTLASKLLVTDYSQIEVKEMVGWCSDEMDRLWSYSKAFLMIPQITISESNLPLFLLWRQIENRWIGLQVARIVLGESETKDWLLPLQNKQHKPL